MTARQLTAATALMTLLAFPAAAQVQRTTVGSGATLTLGGGAVLDLHDGELDFGITGTLEELGTARVTGGTLTATRTLDAPTSVDVAGLGATLTTDQNLGETVVTRSHQPHTSGGTDSIARSFDIQPTNNAGLDATLVFRYHEAGLNGLEESTLVLYRSTDSGATWALMGGLLDETENTITLTGVGELSLWTASGPGLPVELLGFTLE